MVPTPPAHQFVPAASQQFRPVAQGMPGPNVALPSGQTQTLHFPQPTQHLPPRPGPPGQGPPSSQSIPAPYGQPGMPISSGQLPPHQGVQVPNHLSSLAGGGMPLSSSYTVLLSIY